MANQLSVTYERISLSKFAENSFSTPTGDYTNYDPPACWGGVLSGDITPTDSSQRLCSCSLTWSERGFYDLCAFISSIHGVFLSTVLSLRERFRTQTP